MRYFSVFLLGSFLFLSCGDQGTPTPPKDLVEEKDVTYPCRNDSDCDDGGRFPGWRCIEEICIGP